MTPAVTKSRPPSPGATRDALRHPDGPPAAAVCRHRPLTRAAVVVRLTDRLRRHGWPRLQMTVMVALTGLAGWLLSAALLHLGLHSMMLRWPVALLGAWGAFLAMLGVWVRLQRESLEPPDPEDVIDTADLLSEVRLPRVRGGGSGGVSGDGRFGGAGAQDDTVALAGEDDPPMPVAEVMDADAGSRGSSPVGLDLPDLGDADDLTVPVLVIVLAVGMAAASLYVIWTAPTLLAELMFDGAISYGLYRRLRAGDTRAWLGTAVRHTALPFVVTAVLLAGVGWGLHQVRPEARTIAQALHSDTVSDRGR